MQAILLVIFLFVAMAIIALVLLQQGKGSGMGASFGAGASATLFGSSGSSNFMSRTTGILVAIFFILSLVLGNLSNRQLAQGPTIRDSGEFDPTSIQQSVVPTTPSVTLPSTNEAAPEQAIPGTETSTPTNQPEIPQ
ncbi:preprotein translocase subunit SecG [Thorsellia anophelis]